MQDNTIGMEITAIAAGIDSYERRVNNNAGILGDEGLVPLYLGKNLIDERKYENWSEVDEDVEHMGAIVEGTEEGPRRLFLSKLVESLRVATLLFRGGDTNYEEKLTRLVGVPAESIRSEFTNELAEQLESLFSSADVSGRTLAERIRSWEDSHRIDSADLTVVFGGLMLDARERTDRLVVPTDDYMMEINPVRAVDYTARCNFVERKMDLNMDSSFTRTALKHLVAHECFPGHSTQTIYTMKAFRSGTATADVLLCSLNGVTGVIQEGIGDQGVHLINWIEDINDEISATLRRYRSAVATQAAWMINVERIDDQEAHDYLRDVGAMQESQIAGRIGFARHPYRAPFISSYFYGNEAVRRVRIATADDPVRKKAFITDLYSNMHCPESLCWSNAVEYQSYGDT